MEEFIFYYKKVLLKNYFNFEGRARRKEFWMFAVANLVVSVALGIIGSFMGYVASSALSGLYSLAILVPTLGLTVRRMHDIGKSGYVILLALIPLVGVIVLLVWATQEGISGENEYGQNPKEIPEAEKDITF
jgi:uncharacterized membrane protein YhaH (DUF805 family)